MNAITYHMITKETAQDLNIPNEPFELTGRILVSRVDERWTYEVKHFEEKNSMVFPNEFYDYEEIDRKGFAIGAYNGETCVGLAVYQEDWARYMYLYDLKVSADYRQKGIAGDLISGGLTEAKSRGYAGLYTIGQDNNLAACQFYLKQGFDIGGLNTHGYNHTQQEGKADIYFYLE